MKRIITSVLLVSATVLWGAADEPATPAALQSEIDSLRAAKVAWREITWKSCLLDGLNEGRRQKKPVLLWIFIDRPIDDARC